MNFLKKLFSSSPQDSGIYIYIKPKMCDEILKIRINPTSDMNPTENYDGYFVRKLAKGARCPFTSEIRLHFNKRRDLVDREIENGEFATEEDFIAWENR